MQVTFAKISDEESNSFELIVDFDQVHTDDDVLITLENGDVLWFQASEWGCVRIKKNKEN